MNPHPTFFVLHLLLPRHQLCHQLHHQCPPPQIEHEPEILSAQPMSPPTPPPSPEQASPPSALLLGHDHEFLEELHRQLEKQKTDKQALHNPHFRPSPLKTASTSQLSTSPQCPNMHPDLWTHLALEHLQKSLLWSQALCRVKDGEEVLEAYNSNVLVLTGNSSHMVPLHAKLSFQQSPFIVTLNSLIADGRNIAAVGVIKIHSVAYIEFFEDKSR
ncbi:hypothetical protein F4604DRAFT_2036267 [Suillus subluteus]|nr:hypothetical protein F4604DRAFT_2036267 [Suillus subluteus]